MMVLVLAVPTYYSGRHASTYGQMSIPWNELGACSSRYSPKQPAGRVSLYTTGIAVCIGAIASHSFLPLHVVVLVWHTPVGATRMTVRTCTRTQLLLAVLCNFLPCGCICTCCISSPSSAGLVHGHAASF
jgi:hypothetical protein